MKKSDTFSDRRQEAEAAKARLLEKFKARPLEDSPEVRERAAARQVRNAAQAERKAAVELEKRNKAQIMKAEAEAAVEAKRLAEDQQLKEAAEAEEAQKILDEATRKEKRDVRYANRKAKK
jgi:hypothetical protein